MAKVSITQAAKLSQLSRSYFYKKYINTGLISIVIEDNKKLIDVSELMRVCDHIKLEDVSSSQHDTVIDVVKTQEKDKIITMLETQLSEAKAREMQLRRETQEREEWFKAQLATANNLLEDKTSKKRKKFLGIF
ncbi:MAG: hypothetical protein K2Y14_11770 [Burkholderiales bacterium]|nr:hypothetical protein [Burkholderiales bacterium]